MDSKEIAELIKAHVDGVKIVDDRCIFAASDKKRLREILLKLRAEGITHISTITGVDTGDVVEVIYHINCKPAELNLKISLSKTDLKIPTITEIFPGAVLYERDLMEMLGVKVEGHPDPKRLFLPDDWPEGVYPLRKEFREVAK